MVEDTFTYKALDVLLHLAMFGLAFLSGWLVGRQK